MAKRHLDNNSKEAQDHHPSRKHHRISPASSTPPPPAAAAAAAAAAPLKRPTFPSYIETPNLPPNLKLLCEIIATTPPSAVEQVLDATGLRVSQADVEEVLKLSYSFPASAVKFFRWAGLQLNDRHSPYSWNLVVDLLGKNYMFDAMWGAVKSMKREGLVSLATFASIFSSFVIADRVKDAILAFEVMDQYGCQRNVVALNSLLSAVCRDGRTFDAVEFLHVAKGKIRPDSDSYAILLEGWEKERNAVGARQTFSDMVDEFGWDPGNVPAYDTFLSTLLTGRDGLFEALKFFETMRDKRCYPGMKFFRLALEECLKCRDARGAELIWETMVDRIGITPNTQFYNLMIAVQCHTNNTDVAKKFFDGMVYNGSFPDAQTYNLIFLSLIKDRRLKEASMWFNEMVKNEYAPDRGNCQDAIREYLDSKDPYMAIKIWKCMMENHDSGLEETGNLLVVELRYLGMIPEAVKYAEVMIEKGIKLHSSSLSQLKKLLTHERKQYLYEELLKKWKAH
ncbi:hypothetical protein Tsubulata_003715 [Turnera subulata]|uniref:Pentacotripeptide-repeat region of PRORP domain-containing protein n=1 Tax=Turnera subulata TaxID=218843 RepID=A0A9Q0GEE2_9ROSI|nr:hypothetical protein Tsubulata_003715 [Turnera subulata]